MKEIRKNNCVICYAAIILAVTSCMLLFQESKRKSGKSMPRFNHHNGNEITLQAYQYRIDIL